MKSKKEKKLREVELYVREKLEHYKRAKRGEEGLELDCGTCNMITGAMAELVFIIDMIEQLDFEKE